KLLTTHLAHWQRPQRCSSHTSNSRPLGGSSALGTGLPATGGKPGKILVLSSAADANSVAPVDPASATKSSAKSAAYVVVLPPRRNTVNRTPGAHLTPRPRHRLRPNLKRDRIGLEIAL